MLGRLVRGAAASGGVSTGSRRRPTSAGPPGAESTVGSEPTAAAGSGHRRWGLEETGPATHGGRDRHDDGPGRARQGEAAGIRLIGRGEGHGHDGSLDDRAERRVGVDADLPGERDAAQAQLTLDGGVGPGGELTEVEFVGLTRGADPSMTAAASSATDFVSEWAMPWSASRAPSATPRSG